MDGMGVSSSVSSHRAGEIGMIGAIAQWCECLQGRAPLEKAIEMLAQSAGVEAIALTRAARDHDGEVNSLFFDYPGKGERADPLDRSYAKNVLGAYFRQPKPGSVWFKTLTEIEADPRLERFHRRRHLTELAVIPLSVEEKATMFLELHFSVHRGSGQHALINMCAPTLAETWSRRKAGLMTELILKRNRPNPTPVAIAPILSADNPAGLSRAEFRVCMLLSAGLSTKRVRAQLGISESTLRTHLRSVYAKTETCNQSELLFLLLSAKPNREYQTRSIA
jgi:DNA-binding CsgD family transcriptional regulator